MALIFPKSFSTTLLLFWVWSLCCDQNLRPLQHFHRFCWCGNFIPSKNHHSRTVGVPELKGFAVDGSKGSALGWMKRICISLKGSLQEISGHVYFGCFTSFNPYLIYHYLLIKWCWAYLRINHKYTYIYVFWQGRYWHQQPMVCWSSQGSMHAIRTIFSIDTPFWRAQ